jgi:hypothetical protein
MDNTDFPTKSITDDTFFPIKNPKGSVGKRLQTARRMLQGMNLKKGGNNQRFKYFELQDFLPPLIDIFDKLDLTHVITMDSDRVVLEIMDVDNIDEKITFSMPMVPFDKIDGKLGSFIQGLGAVQTYMRRYLYMLAMEITENDWIDSCGDEKPPVGEPQASATKPSVSATATKATAMRNKSEEDANFYGVYNRIDSISTLNELNRSFRILKTHENKFKTDEWKKQLLKKGESIGATFNKSANVFTAGSKSAAVAAMISASA